MSRRSDRLPPVVTIKDGWSEDERADFRRWWEAQTARPHAATWEPAHHRPDDLKLFLGYMLACFGGAILGIMIGVAVGWATAPFLQ